MFDHWSPAQLAFVMGYRIDIRSHGSGQRNIFLVGRCGKSHHTGYDRAHRTLSRLARAKCINPEATPISTPRALINGQEQVPQ